MVALGARLPGDAMTVRGNRRGFALHYDWIGEPRERALLDAVRELGTANPVAGRAYVFRLGHAYEAPHQQVTPVPDVFYSAVAEHTSPCAYGTGRPPGPCTCGALSFWRRFDTVSVNVYRAGEGITPHTDSLDFEDEIRVLSIGTDVVGGRSSIVLTPGWDESEAYPYPRPLPKPIVVPRRSLTILSGEIRQKWRHEIVCEKPYDGRSHRKHPTPGDADVRTSIVYRRLKDEVRTAIPKPGTFRTRHDSSPSLAALVGSAHDVITPPERK